MVKAVASGDAGGGSDAGGGGSGDNVGSGNSSCGGLPLGLC